MIDDVRIDGGLKFDQIKLIDQNKHSAFVTEVESRAHDRWTVDVGSSVIFSVLMNEKRFPSLILKYLAIEI